ncbi:hypothetical protein [Streptomyces sp. NPDC057557]|uniref:hypothetical protein n=1 Tax=Streptomyces sp. NPDC057557 TaxID=3346167 RepID=UPI0036C27797
MPTVTLYDTLTIPARDIRRGDVFDLHRHTRTAAHDAYPYIRGSVGIPLEGGGVAYLPKGEEIHVSRPAGTMPCTFA